MYVNICFKPRINCFFKILNCQVNKELKVCLLNLKPLKVSKKKKIQTITKYRQIIKSKNFNKFFKKRGASFKNGNTYFIYIPITFISKASLVSVI